jgi:heme/copper-type cytochrome/quinol oxidase subunit 1
MDTLPFPYNQNPFCRYEPIEQRISHAKVLIVNNLLRYESDMSDLAQREWSGTAKSKLEFERKVSGMACNNIAKNVIRLVQNPKTMTVHLSETSFVHAHFHFIMGLMATFAVFAAVYHWFPKMTGRSADSMIAKVAFWLKVAGTQVTFWPLFIIGVQGMPRRYWNYEMFPQFEPYHRVATMGAFLIAVGVTLMIVGWIWSALYGPRVGNNPWRSRSLEWTHAESPPGPGNFPKPVTVPEGWTPYDYH